MTGPILVVEDDPTLVHAIMRNLAVHGYLAMSASSVAEAVAVIAAGRPALVVLDIDLPDGSGWEVLRELRSAGYEVPTVVMSALRPNQRLVAELHCAGVLEKPFPMDSLLRLVTQHIGRPAVAPADDQPEKES